MSSTMVETAKEQKDIFLNEFLERMYSYTQGNEDEISLKRRLITIGYNLANKQKNEAKYKELLDSHNELLEALIKSSDNIWRYKKLIEKAKNIKQ